eukprot:TRINITY_DN3445_c0_g1_i5.p1 TRINITY_DN3445_c0_g1~~TRINITY_DN3445_c0_g1_i5.p1  ORF type:complete len:113 (+),score=6.32 TRINITY_DN3445_c0_g1_i5:227-565(+)
MSLLLRSALLRASVQQRGAVLPMAQRTFSSAPQKQIGDAYYTAPSITQEKAAAEAQGGRYVNPFEDPYAGLHYQWRTQDVREEDEVCSCCCCCCCCCCCYLEYYLDDVECHL